MKRILALPGIAMAFLLASCENSPQSVEAPSTQNATQGQGKVALTVKLGNVGMLARKAEMVPTRLVLQFYSFYGAGTIVDTVEISGPTTYRSTYEIPAGYWEISAVGYDQNGIPLYSGYGTFMAADGQVTNLNIGLDAQYSGLKVRFPVQDSLVRYTLSVDGQVWADTLVQSGSKVGDTITIEKDYLTAGTWGYGHQFTLRAYGPSATQLAYQADTSLYVYSGQKQGAVFTLHWVGGGSPIGQKTNLIVTCGPVGMLTIDAQYSDDPIIVWNNSIGYSWMYDYREAGRIYRGIYIGNKTWMAENLSTGLSSLQQSFGRCYADNPVKCATYGRLYDFKEANGSKDSIGLDMGCLSGSRIPSSSEWQALLRVVDSTVGGKDLKSANGWMSQGSGTDLHGFRAIPAGIQTASGEFQQLGSNAYFWSSTEVGPDSAIAVALNSQDDKAKLVTLPKLARVSVRCVMDP